MNYYSCNDNGFSRWEFSIPYTVLRDTPIDLLKEKIYEFHMDYIALSQQYKIAELVPTSILEKNNININKVYGEYLSKALYVDNCLIFFPFNNFKIPDVNIIWGYGPCSSELSLIMDGKLYSDYCFIFSEKKIVFLEDIQSNTNLSGGFPAVRSYWDMNIDLNNSEWLEEDAEVSFVLELQSDIWFDELSYHSELIRKRTVFDNRFIAYRNTPRLNSFLRGLISLFTDKYNWEFNEVENSIYSVGIPLDGKIIYQEDIDEGRIEVPRFL